MHVARLQAAACRWFKVILSVAWKKKHCKCLSIQRLLYSPLCQPMSSFISVLKHCSLRQTFPGVSGACVPRRMLLFHPLTSYIAAEYSRGMKRVRRLNHSMKRGSQVLSSEQFDGDFIYYFLYIFTAIFGQLWVCQWPMTLWLSGGVSHLMEWLVDHEGI